ncbi:MAG: chromosomal replication initiator protein DnaA [Candidatus Pacebacteria bacterium]|nr:chromosomal replication initiator protein DnaA [Candidatus Paceibacterota bacterium]
MNKIKETWDKTLAEIEIDISKPNYNTWFKKTFAADKQGSIFFVGVPNEFNKEWLQTRFNDMILKSISKHDSSITKIEYIVKKTQTSAKEIKSKKDSFQENSLPLQKSTVNKNNNLNEKYSFNSFVVGPFNELAYSASQAIIKKPGVYNPLFIYGPTGLGKTHLIQATGNSVYKNNDTLNIFYTSSEKFSQDYVNALTNNRINQFKNRYRNYDVFIMDDIQFFSGKEKLQEELFHLFNILYDKGKQIIFSSDKHPNYIIGLEDRLRSRFSAGMIVDITKPDYESRSALLKTKTTEKNIPISEEVVDYLATNLEGNIRELEGVLNAIIIQTDLRSRKLTIVEVKNLIKNNVKPKKHLALEEIIKIIAGFYSTDPELIYEKTRKKEIVNIRQITMYMLREYFNISYPAIGKEVGGRDHTTVIHSYEKIKKKLKDDPSLVQEIEQLCSILNV